MPKHVIPFENLRNTDVGKVGGKNASLGEMISQLHAKGVRVPTGFATTAHAFNEFLGHNDLGKRIEVELENLDVNDVNKLAKLVKQLGSGLLRRPFQPILIKQSLKIINS